MGGCPCILEGLDVYPERFARAQGELLIPKIQIAGSSGQGRFEDPAGEVERSVQVVCGRLRLKLWPEQVYHLLPMQPVPRREGEQLHQAPGLAQSPLVVLDGSRPHRHPEAAEQPDTHGLALSPWRYSRFRVALLGGLSPRIRHPLELPTR